MVTFATLYHLNKWLLTKPVKNFKERGYLNANPNFEILIPRIPCHLRTRKRLLKAFKKLSYQPDIFLGVFGLA
jgi:hypothetical protein